MGYFGVVIQQVPSGPPAPGGNNRQVQFNDNGVLAGNSGLKFRKASSTLEVGGPVKAGGQITTVLQTEPADADLANGELAIWYEAALQRVGYKAKDNAGSIWKGFSEMNP